MGSFKTYTDGQLVGLLRQQDGQEAMTEIYNRYWLKLLAVASNRLSNEQEAEECVQDVFLSLWNKRAQLVLRHELSTYLWVAIKYQVINRLDKRFTAKSIHTTELQEHHSPIVPSPETLVLEAELIARIEQVVARLPEKCRMVYRMRQDEGKSNKSISEALHISEKTVEGHMTRALKEIRGNLHLVYPMFLVYSVLLGLKDKL